MEEKTPSTYFHSDDVKDQFVLEFYKAGSLKGACEVMKIPYETAKMWHRQEWWSEKYSRVKTQADTAMDRKITVIVDQAFEQIEDRIKNGEERLDKNGKVVMVKANLSSLATTAGILFDKRQLIRKSPTNVDTPEDVLTKLAEKLVQFAKPKKEVIDVEFREKEEETGTDTTTDRGVSEGLPQEPV
jgi:hypothetical protein